jgi:hypothetical protein
MTVKETRFRRSLATSRARNVALTRLASLYPQTFQTFYVEAMQEVTKEERAQQRQQRAQDAAAALV